MEGGSLPLVGVGVAVKLEGAEVVVDPLVLAVDGSGRGQVASCDSCGQHSQILLYKYNCRLGESPDGRRRSPVVLQQVEVSFHSI